MDENRYTLTEHLQELRTRIIRSLLVIVIATAASFALAPMLFDWLQMPLNEVLQKNNHIRTVLQVGEASEDGWRQRLESVAGMRIVARADDADEALQVAARKRADLILVELGQTAPVPPTSLAPEARPQVLPLQSVASVRAELPRVASLRGKARSQRLHVLSLMELLIAYIKIALLAGLLLASPWWLYQLWAFVAPGLYPQERHFAAPFILVGSLLFVGGALFAYYAVFPWGFQYLVGMLPDEIAGTYTVEKYYGIATRLMLAFGIIFELPLVMGLLGLAGLVTPEMLTKYRKYAIVMAFVVAGVLTPPDPITQLAMAAPLVIFYELGAIAVRILGRHRREPPPAEADAT